MKATLYFVNTVEEYEDRSTNPPTITRSDRSGFGPKPYDAKYQAKYDAMSRTISLEQDVGWNEAKLQTILRRSGFYEGFPLPDSVVVTAEFKPGGIEQRIDILCLTSQGVLVPCELKLRGDYPDSHGQLLRYAADLTFDTWDLPRVIDAHTRYLGTISDGVASSRTKQRFLDFIEQHKSIPTTGPLAVRAGGVIIDSSFKESTRVAVRYLNQRGFSIELVQFTVRVPNDWDAASDERWMRIDFETVVP